MSTAGPWDFTNPACKGEDLTTFYGKSEDKPMTSREESKAKKICVTCPHVAECLEWAVENETFGVWGGASESERRRMKRRVYRERTRKRSAAMGGVIVGRV